jgi:hypothetical protein
MHLARLFTARNGEFDAAEGLLRSVIERSRSIGSASQAYEATLHLADCLTRSGRPVDALAELTPTARSAATGNRNLRSRSVLVEASALVELGRSAEAAALVVRGVAAAREQWLTFDLARLLLLAARIGPPFDDRLGTAEPVEEAQRLLDRLGVVTAELP